MGDFYCFNVGTSHNRNEPQNLLAKLWTHCPGQDLSQLGHSTGSSHVMLYNPAFSELRRIESSRRDRTRNYKYINDGVGSKHVATEEGGGVSGTSALFGRGLSKKARDTVEVINVVDPDRIFLVGHSRGAILSLEIGHLLAAAGSRAAVFMFLLDPCKASLQETKELPGFGTVVFYNTTRIQVVAMEDVHDTSGYKGGFTLCHLRETHAPSTDLKPDRLPHLDPANYIRMPGQHGTGSQVNGFPIGELTYEIARHFIARNSFENPRGPSVIIEPETFPILGNGDPDLNTHTDRICDLYSQVLLVNTTLHKRQDLVSSRYGRLVGRTSVGRVINDGNRFVVCFTDSRHTRMEQDRISNPFRGHPFFVNPHHYELFRSRFAEILPVIARHAPLPSGYRPPRPTVPVPLPPAPRTGLPPPPRRLARGLPAPPPRVRPIRLPGPPPRAPLAPTAHLAARGVTNMAALQRLRQRAPSAYVLLSIVGDLYMLGEESIIQAYHRSFEVMSRVLSALTSSIGREEFKV